MAECALGGLLECKESGSLHDCLGFRSVIDAPMGGVLTEGTLTDVVDGLKRRVWHRLASLPAAQNVIGLLSAFRTSAEGVDDLFTSGLKRFLDILDVLANAWTKNNSKY